MPEQLPLAETPTLTPPPRVARPKRRYTWTMGMGNNDIEKQQAEEIIASVDPGPCTPPVEYPDFIARNNFDDMPPGWCLLAREQDFYANGSLHRRFGWSFQLCLHYKAGRIAQLEKQVLELGREEEAHGKDALHSLTPWQLGIEGEGTRLSSKRDKLIQELDKELYSYGRTMKHALMIHQAPKVSRVEAANLLQRIEHAGILNKAAAWQFREIDDFITTRDQTKAIPDFIETLVYGAKGSFADFIMKPFVNKRKSECSTGTTHYSHEPIKQVFLALSASAVLLILLAPIAFLYFVEPGKPVSFSVVAISAIVASLMMLQLPGIKLETVFLAAAAHVAVQVTCLANFQGFNR